MHDTSPPPTRRRWIQSAAIVTVGSALGARAILELNSRDKGSEQPGPMQSAPPKSPEEPLISSHDENSDEAATEAISYKEFLASFNFRHIRPREIISPHRKTTRGVRNTLPPLELWSGMPATLFVADEIRERLGRPLTQITSAYRTPEYNKACGGASRSWHMRNCALDLVFDQGPDEAYAIACELRNEGLFQGGIGLYETFIHIDTRGENATWQA